VGGFLTAYKEKSILRIIFIFNLLFINKQKQRWSQKPRPISVGESEEQQSNSSPPTISMQRESGAEYDHRTLASDSYKDWSSFLLCIFVSDRMTGSSFSSQENQTRELPLFNRSLTFAGGPHGHAASAIHSLQPRIRPTAPALVVAISA
jgi:hypothetical protein